MKLLNGVVDPQIKKELMIEEEGAILSQLEEAIVQPNQFESVNAKDTPLRVFQRDASAMEQNYMRAQRKHSSKVSIHTKDVGVQYSERYKFSAESEVKLAFCSCNGTNTCSIF